MKLLILLVLLMPYYKPGGSVVTAEESDKPLAINQPENAIQRFPTGASVLEYDGAVYAVDITDDNYQPVIYKTEDWGETWTIPDEANVPPARFTFKTVSDGTGTLHIFLANYTSNLIDYETFDCSADTYDLDVPGSGPNNSPTITAVNNAVIRTGGTFWVIYESTKELYAVNFNGSSWGTPVHISNGITDGTYTKRLFALCYDPISDSVKFWIKATKFGQPTPIYYRILDSAGSLGSASLFEDDMKDGTRDYYASGYAVRFGGNIVVCYGRIHTDLSGKYALYIRNTDDVDSDSPTWTSELEIAYENTAEISSDVDALGYLAASGSTLYCWFSNRSFAADHSPPLTYDGETISYVTSVDLTTWSDTVNLYDYPVDPVYSDDVLSTELVAVLGDTGWHVLTNYNSPSSHSLYYFLPVAVERAYHWAY